MDKTPDAMLDYLKSRGCRVGGVTMGEQGLLWYDETGAVRRLPALPIARERVIDTNGAGDVFHGAYVYSYLSQSRAKAGRIISSLRARPRPTRSSASATRLDCRRLPISTAVKQEFQIGRKKEFWD